MEPEIARRCPACGASVRGGSAFCPQCGKSLGADAAGAVAAAEASELPAQSKSEPAQNSPLLATQPGTVGAAPAVTTEDAGSARVVEAAKTLPAETPVIQGDETDARPKRQRLAAAREAVGEKISPRVEKLRHASNVVLEEASYDPSLRFVLIALVIFLISLLLFFLNRLLG